MQFPSSSPRALIQETKHFRYHQWMQDPVLRSQTASEPLTLEQEHEMQQSWIRDDDSKMDRCVVTVSRCVVVREI